MNKLRPENNFDTLTSDSASTPATKAAFEAAGAFQSSRRACIDALALIDAVEAHLSQADAKAARVTLGLVEDLMSVTAGMIFCSRGSVDSHRKQIHPEFPLTDAVLEMLKDQDEVKELLIGASVLARGLKAVIEGDSATHLLRFAREHVDSCADHCDALEEYAVIMFREFVKVEASPELAVAMSNADKLSALQREFESSMDHVLNLSEGVIEAFLSDDPMQAMDHLEHLVGTAKQNLRKLGIDAPKRSPNVRHACDRLKAKWESVTEGNACL